ncbi:hypothetical protein GCM10023231_16480 [Olivibacter ginsenosidimutans]|uniref:DUF1214 domain-containing protein n=1 Tax=Olivibacter ginsenosidimutans TaxID=1176537 RepID=A0ABP9B352_9SPHI
MGTFKKGINGSFSGKTGSIIGSKWKSIPYMKGLPRLKKHATFSEAQLKQQEKFKLLLDFLMPIHRLLAIGFRQYLNRQTQLNAAMKGNYDLALYEEEGKTYVNFRKVQFSQGVLFTPGNEQAKYTPEGIEVSWHTKTYGVRGDNDDQVYIVFYQEDEARLYMPGSAIRSDGHYLIKIDKQWGPIQHVWLFLCSTRGKEVSRTVYVPITDSRQ